MRSVGKAEKQCSDQVIVERGVDCSKVCRAVARHYERLNLQ